MRILVAGATGAVGRPLVPALLAGGHSVVGLTRSPAKAALIAGWGAEPVVCDGLDEVRLRAVVLAAAPDVVIHEMTDLAGASDLRHFDRTFARSNLLRTRGLDILLGAAREAGARRFIAQSFCGWPYARVGEAVKSEAEALDPKPPEEMRRTLEAIRYLERTVTESPRPAGIVLRYGALYGPHTGVFEASMVAQIRRRRVPLIGGGGGWWSFTHVADAAAATALAVARGKPGSIYNIVDDEPAPVREWLPVLAELLDARPPLRIPAWLARIAAGPHLVSMMTRARAGSNGKARRELGWRPDHPSWRGGFAEAAHSPLERPSAPAGARVSGRAGRSAPSLYRNS